MGGHAVAGPRRILAATLPAAVLAVAALAAAGCTRASYYTEPVGGMRIGVAYGQAGPQDGSVNQAARAAVLNFANGSGTDVSAVHQFVAVPDEPADDRYDRLIILCQSGYNPVIAIGDAYAGTDPQNGPVARAARACPATRFAVVGDPTVDAPNVANLVFADAQGAYLMGVVAARTSRTHQVGFLALCHTAPFTAVEAGYRAGVEAGSPGTQVFSKYLSEQDSTCPDGIGERDARLAADGLYGGGADVVYQTVGPTGSTGVFESAKAHGGFAIGTGGDQFSTADPGLRDVILTSQVDRVDAAVSDFLHGLAKGAFHTGVTRYDVGNDGIRYTTTGGHIDALVPVVEGYRKRIADGSIAVPGSP
jgi:basic membrane protein A and related proteins